MAQSPAKPLLGDVAQSPAKWPLFPLEEWVLQREEEAVDVEIAILDAHHHLWLPGEHDKGWPVPKFAIQMMQTCGPKCFNYLIPKADPKIGVTFGNKCCPLAMDYMGPQLTADIRGRDGKGHNVVGTVYIESNWATPGVPEHMQPYGNVDMVAAVHKEFPNLCNGMVPFADLALGSKVEPLLKKYGEHPLVKGIRFGIYWEEKNVFAPNLHASKGTSRTAPFREGFALLAKYDLCFDTWCYHTQIDEVTELAESFPEQTIVLDHFGYALGMGGYSLEESRVQWEASMVALAKCPNVYCKVGGLGSVFWGFGFDADNREKPAGSDELAEKWAPWLLFAIEQFGVDRCIMESNFPVDKVSGSYTILFNALKKITRCYSLEDRQKLFEQNARKVYKL